jgi:hypothetical protein
MAGLQKILTALFHRLSCDSAILHSCEADHMSVVSHQSTVAGQPAIGRNSGSLQRLSIAD